MAGSGAVAEDGVRRPAGGATGPGDAEPGDTEPEGPAPDGPGPDDPAPGDAAAPERGTAGRDDGAEAAVEGASAPFFAPSAAGFCVDFSDGDFSVPGPDAGGRAEPGRAGPGCEGSGWPDVVRAPPADGFGAEEPGPNVANSGTADAGVADPGVEDPVGPAAAGPGAADDRRAGSADRESPGDGRGDGDAGRGAVPGRGASCRWTSSR